MVAKILKHAKVENCLKCERSSFMNAFIKYLRCLVVVVAGAAMMIFGVRGIIINNSNPVNLIDPSTDWSKLKNGTHIEMDMDFLADYYISAFEDDEEISAQYLFPEIVSTDDGYYEMRRFIGVLSPASTAYKYDNLCQESYDFWMGETDEWPSTVIHVDGYLRKMDNDEKEAAIEVLKNMGFEESALVPYVILNNQNVQSYLLIAGGGLLIVIVGAASMLFIFLKNRS